MFNKSINTLSLQFEALFLRVEMSIDQWMFFTFVQVRNEHKF